MPLADKLPNLKRDQLKQCFAKLWEELDDYADDDVVMVEIKSLVQTIESIIFN